MKDYKLLECEKNTSIVSGVTGKVLKTIPLSYKGNKQEFVQKWFDKLSFKKRLTELMQKVLKKEPYAFALIHKQEIKGARIVELRDGFRFELIYENNVRINIDELLYHLCENKLETVYLNY